jgi:hypothetical protein
LSLVILQVLKFFAKDLEHRAVEQLVKKARSKVAVRSRDGSAQAEQTLEKDMQPQSFHCFWPVGQVLFG